MSESRALPIVGRRHIGRKGFVGVDGVVIGLRYEFDERFLEGCWKVADVEAFVEESGDLRQK